MSATPTTTPVTTGWQIDTAHSGVDFSVRHLMISTVRGRLGAIQGSLQSSDPARGATAIDATIDVAGIDTGNAQRDAHLRSADFFDVENHPTIRFTTSAVPSDTSGEFSLTGELTIRGTTQPITFKVEAQGETLDPWGNRRLGFSAQGKLSRSSFGLTWNQVLEAGGVTVGDEVKFTIDLALVQPAS